jgi:glycosyltransferase involved in cell wall biosynthesis
MACSLPLVARASAGLAELVDDSVGRAVERGTPAAFADALADLFAGDTALLRAAARQRAASRDWKQVLPGLWQHYRGLLDGGLLDDGPPARLRTG